MLDAWSWVGLGYLGVRRVTTRVTTPQALLVYSIVKYQPSEYGTYRFPSWAELLGILMGLLSCIVIPACMLAAILKEEGTLWEVSICPLDLELNPNPMSPIPMLIVG